MSYTNKAISSRIKRSLHDSAYRARKNIEENKDLYMDSEHKLLCEYYKKYMEQTKKFENEKIKITFNTFKVAKHILSDSHDKKDEIILKDYKINFEVFYNKYNKKFINKLYVLTDIKDYEDWIEDQNIFIKSLTPEEIFTLRCHTHDGDIIINYFIRNNLHIDKDIDIVGNENQRKSTLIIEKRQFKSNRNYILFYYQIKEYLYQKYKELSKLSRLDFEEYIIKNYKDFEWDKILLLYIRDINKIFDKCPVVKKTLVIYRGSYNDYFLQNSKRGTYITQTLSSHTLNPKIAIGYAGIGCCVMRVKLSKGCKAILIDNISGYEEEEILLPFNTKYYIDFARHSINYYKNNIICPDETRATKINVTDLSIIPPIQKLPKSFPKSFPKSSPKSLSKSLYNFSLLKNWTNSRK
jgi:hypothetical protein